MVSVVCAGALFTAWSTVKDVFGSLSGGGYHDGCFAEVILGHKAIGTMANRSGMLFTAEQI